MNKPLKRVTKTLFYFDEKGNMIEGVHKDIEGNISGIWGDVSGIRGDVSGIRGDVSGISGDFDLIPMNEREGKPNVEDWIET